MIHIILEHKVEVSIRHNELPYLLYVNEFDFYPGHPGSGPSYSCGGEPPDPEEAVPTIGFVKLECEVEELRDLTSAEMDDIVLMTNSNEEFFDFLCCEYAENIESVLLDKYYELEYQEMEYRAELEAEWNSNL